MSKIKEFFQNLVKKENIDNDEIDEHDEIVEHNEMVENDEIGEHSDLRGVRRYKNAKALLIGINYRGTSSELKGCINDVKNMYHYLTTIENFNPKNIRVLTDEKHTPSNELPTRANIISSINWLVHQPYKKGPKRKTSLFIHYSGHGSWVRERGRNKDEEDGRDETICPLDYERAGLIKDDELRRLIVDPIKNMYYINLTALFDCCHSGTILDLRYHVNTQVVPNQSHSRRIVIDENKHYSKGLAKITLFSGSMDKQYSADALIQRKHQGMMTFAYLDVIKKCKKKGVKLTYKKFITALQVFAAENGYDQIPQLSTNHCPQLKDVYNV